MTKAELIQKLRALEAEGGGARRAETMSELRHDLSVHQIELEASRDRYAELYDFAPLAYVNFDERGVVCALNLAAGALLGFDRAEVIGQPFSQYLDGDSAIAFRKHLERCSGRDPRERHSTELRVRVAGTFPVAVLLTTVFMPKGGSANGPFFSTLQNLTDRKRAEELQQNYARELQRTVAERTAELREANAELQQFTTSVSHDLRSPLRTMRGYAEILLEESGSKLDQTSRECAQRIVAGAARLDGLLHDLLEYSRVSRVELALGSIDLHVLVEETVRAHQAAHKGPASRISVEVPPRTHVTAHSSVLGQVLWNLLENAHKFVGPGVTPIIAVRAEPRDRFHRLWVEDNGIGIPPAFHDKIFSLFQRLHGTAFEGTGVGLAIARRALTRMGGQIGVESAEGQGSRFWFELPAAREPVENVSN